MNVKIESIRIINSEKSPNLKASCQVVLNELIRVDNVLLKHSPQKGVMYIEMPKRKNAQGEYVDVANPATADLSAKIKAEVLRAYKLKSEYTPTEQATSNEPVLFNLHTAKENGSAKAYGDMWLGKEFVVHNITIREGNFNGDNKLFVAMPSRQDDNGNWWNYIYPANDEARETINKYGVSAYNRTQKQVIGNTPYKELKENNTEISVYRNQNVKYGEKVGEALNALGVKWSGFIDSKGIAIVVSSEDADMYASAVAAVKEVDKTRSAEKAAENTVEKSIVVEETSETFAIEDDYPF